MLESNLKHSSLPFLHLFFKLLFLIEKRLVVAWIIRWWRNLLLKVAASGFSQCEFLHSLDLLLRCWGLKNRLDLLLDCLSCWPRWWWPSPVPLPRIAPRRAWISPVILLMSFLMLWSIVRITAVPWPRSALAFLVMFWVAIVRTLLAWLPWLFFLDRFNVLVFKLTLFWRGWPTLRFAWHIYNFIIA